MYERSKKSLKIGKIAKFFKVANPGFATFKNLTIFPIFSDFLLRSYINPLMIFENYPIIVSTRIPRPLIYLVCSTAPFSLFKSEHTETQYTWYVVPPRSLCSKRRIPRLSILSMQYRPNPVKNENTQTQYVAPPHYLSSKLRIRAMSDPDPIRFRFDSDSNRVGTYYGRRF